MNYVETVRNSVAGLSSEDLALEGPRRQPYADAVANLCTHAHASVKRKTRGRYRYEANLANGTVVVWSRYDRKSDPKDLLDPGLTDAAFRDWWNAQAEAMAAVGHGE